MNNLLVKWLNELHLKVTYTIESLIYNTLRLRKMLVQEHLIEIEHYFRCKDKAKKSYDVFKYMQLHMSKYQ